MSMQKTDSIVMPTRITIMDTNNSQFKVSKVTPAYWKLTLLLNVNPMSIAHNKQETPLFAASIERHAHRRAAAA
jgi:hypothetical protein